MVSIPLVQNGSKDVEPEPASSALNVVETYTVDVIRGAAPHRHQGGRDQRGHRQRRRSTSRSTTSATKTIPNYVAYANGHIWPIAVPGCAQNGRVFVGQRKDPFVVNLGETFDLVNIKYPAVELNPLAEFATVDSLGDKNVTSIILELPIRVPDRGQGRRSSARGRRRACR